MNIEEKIEIVYNAYERTLDFDIACLRAYLTDEEREIVENDEDLRFRIDLCDAEVREDIISSLRELAAHGNDKMRFQANVKLGEILYKKRFNNVKSNEDDDSKTRPTKIILEGV